MKTLEEVLAYENPRILKKFRTIFSLSKEEADEIFTELKKFLWLCATRRLESGSDIEGVPRVLVVHRSMVIMDELWHVFILHTEDYINFTEGCLGCYIHHSPAQSDFQPLSKEEAEIQLSYIWEKLGEETVLTWYERFDEQYSPERLQQLLRPHEFGRPCEGV